MAKTYQTILIIFVAFISSTFLYLIIGFFLRQSGLQPLHPKPMALLVVFLLISLIDMAMAAKFKNDFFAPAIPRIPAGVTPHSALLGRVIVTFALSEVPAILGLVYFLLSARMLWLLVFCSLSVLSFLIVFPRHSEVDDFYSRLPVESRQ